MARVPVMIDSSKWSGHRSRSQVRAGQGHRQLDQLEGRRRRLLWKRLGLVRRYGAGGRRDGLRRGGAGRWTVERKVEICERAYQHPRGPRRASRRAISSSTPTCSPSPPGIEEHNDYADQVLHRGGTRQIKRASARAQGQRRRQQPQLLVPRQRPWCAKPCTPPSSTTRCAGRNGHGHRQRRSTRGVRGHSRPTCSARRGRPTSTAAPTPPSGWSSSLSTVKGTGRSRRARPDVGERAASRKLASTHALVQRRRRLHRGRHRGGSACRVSATARSVIEGR